MLFTQLAPAGTRVSARQLLRWAAALPRAEQARADLQRGLQERYGARHVFFVSSGRAALVLLFQTLARLKGTARNEVVVPAYTCYSVPAAAVRAGLRVRVCDIEPTTLSYDINALAAIDFSNVLAIVSSNLYGLPNDLLAIEAIARRHDVFFVDDAAQCLDGRIGGRAAGSFGDVGLFSFDKGKNITSIQGGVLLTQSDALASALARTLAALPPASPRNTLAQTLQLFVYATLLRPWLYWIPANLPFLGLGQTVYNLDYPITQYSPVLAPVAAHLFEGIERLTAARVETATTLLRAIAGAPGIDPIEPVPGSGPVYLRLPLLVRTSTRRAALLIALARLGASGSYPQAIVDVAPLQPHLVGPTQTPGGRRVAAGLITLPTHAYVRQRHVDAIARAIYAPAGAA